jgi:hypothetical protein
MDKKQRILIFSGVFGDSHLDKTAGITDDILEKVNDDIYSKTFEEGVEATPFEEHVAVHQPAYRLAENWGPMDMPDGTLITRKEFEDKYL